MKQYVIAGYTSGKIAEMVPPRPWNGGLVFAQVQDVALRPDHFTGDNLLYFADDEESANGLASKLAAARPGTHWVVAKSASTFRCSPGPVARANFTEQGMLPPL